MPRPPTVILLRQPGAGIYSSLTRCLLVENFRRQLQRSRHEIGCRGTWSQRRMLSEAMCSDGRRIYSAAIASVSPPALIRRALEYTPDGGTLVVQGREYTLRHNVKVAAFGKAVLGMVTALEDVIGEHIMEGVASVPMGTMEMAGEAFPQYLPKKDTRIRIHEGAADNLPDAAAELAAREILSLAQEAGEGELLVTLVSGGGSALLPCPPLGVTLQEKRKVVEGLARAGASIQELNTFRKSLSLTKGGKLAEAAFPAKVLALILSDVIGDPLDIVASGPTVPDQTSHADVLKLAQKYSLTEKLPAAVLAHLQRGSLSPGAGVSMEGGGYSHVQNVVIGSNRIATEAACAVAEDLGYNCHVWSHQVQGEARTLGEVFARIADTYMKHVTVTAAANLSARDALRGELYRLLDTEPLARVIRSIPELRGDFSSLFEHLAGVVPPVCIISGGEPTVTVRGRGRGGRNQELALSFALHTHQGDDGGSPGDEQDGPTCVFLSVGTDGQDGPCDAAGAMVDAATSKRALAEGLDAMAYLDNNDSYRFFSRLNGGRQLIQTGLTGTNVMDLQILLIR